MPRSGTSCPSHLVPGFFPRSLTTKSPLQATADYSLGLPPESVNSLKSVKSLKAATQSLPQDSSAPPTLSPTSHCSSPRGSRVGKAVRRVGSALSLATPGPDQLSPPSPKPDLPGPNSPKVRGARCCVGRRPLHDHTSHTFEQLYSVACMPVLLGCCLLPALCPAAGGRVCPPSQNGYPEEHVDARPGCTDFSLNTLPL